MKKQLKMKKLVPLQRDLKCKIKEFLIFNFQFLIPRCKAWRGQSMTEYLLVVFLISFAVLEAVRTFGIALNAAFAQAIINIAVNIK